VAWLVSFEDWECQLPFRRFIIEGVNHDDDGLEFIGGEPASSVAVLPNRQADLQ
jgi:hypothetical protein